MRWTRWIWLIVGWGLGGVACGGRTPPAAPEPAVPDAPAPRSDAPAPRSDAPAPRSDAPAPRSDAPAPRSDALYFVLVDRFADGRPDAEGAVDGADPQAFHGGDLPGLLDHLDHLDELGVGGVWLSPVTAMRTEKIDEWGAFHGYWVTDLGEVEPRFGTWDDVAALSDALHARDMRLYLDMVYNHVGYDAPLIEAHPDWFHGNGDVQDWDDPVQVVTHDVHGLPDLAQERPEVYDYLLERSLRWVERARPDGFRVDAVRHLPPGFLARLGDDLRARSGRDLELLGEVFEGDPDRLAARFHEDRLDAVFDFPLHYATKDVFCDDRPVGRIASVLSDRPYLGGGAAPPGDGIGPLVTFLDNHDVGRIRSACGEDDARVQQALAFWLTARGTPCITYGTETGLLGAEEPHNRGDMRFGEAHPLGDALKHWLGLRARSEALVDGITVIASLDDRALVTVRATDDEAVLVAINRGEAPIAAEGLSGALAEAWLVQDATGPVAASPNPAGAFDAPGGSVLVARYVGPGAFADLVAAHGAADDVRVELVAEGLPLQPGDRAVLVGGGEGLGRWDPGAGVVGVADGDRVRFDLEVPAGEVLACKLVVVRSSGDAVWEERGDRYLRAGDEAVELRWGR